MKMTADEKFGALSKFFLDEDFITGLVKVLNAEQVKGIINQISHEKRYSEYMLAQRVLNCPTQREGLELLRRIANAPAPEEPRLTKNGEQS